MVYCSEEPYTQGHSWGASNQPRDHVGLSSKINFLSLPNPSQRGTKLNSYLKLNGQMTLKILKLILSYLKLNLQRTVSRISSLTANQRGESLTFTSYSSCFSVDVHHCLDGVHRGPAFPKAELVL